MPAPGIVLILAGGSCGLLIVPLNGLIQSRAPASRRGSVIALVNFFNIAGMVLGSLAAMGMASLGLGMRSLFILSALLVIAGTLWAIRLLPEALLRLTLIILTRLVYRIRIKGAEEIPLHGPALLASNHLSFVDGLLVMAAVKRPVRFLISSEYCKKWWFSPIARAISAIPVSTTDSPKALIKAFQEAGEALDCGQIVCIFPEGQISRTGQMQPFHRGIEKILRGRQVPLIPVHLDRLWESVFSFRLGKPLKYAPKGLFLPVTVSIGKKLSANTSVQKLRQSIQELGCEAWFDRKSDQRPLHVTFIKQARTKPFTPALIDETQSLCRLKTLVSAVALAREFSSQLKTQEAVGLFLPTGIPAVLSTLALALSGRCPVNLNFTIGSSALSSAVKQARLQTVITSRRFLELSGYTPPEGVQLLYLEDVQEKLSWKQRAYSLFLALCAPAPSLERACGAEVRADMDSLAALIFTSGSTGEPKGVMLSHFNIASNVEAVNQVMPRRDKNDKILGILPLFHSFGTLSMWLGLNEGVALVLHSNPLDCSGIGRLVERHAVTLLLATPSFLHLYERRMTPGQLGSLRMVLTGAERLSPSLAEAFLQRFGIRPIEGYGATECAPVVATSTLDFRAAGTYQVGAIPGTVGQAVPGVATRIVDPETYSLLDCEEEGMLLVRGPNVMKGYLGRDDLTAAVMHEGWYITGDIAAMDSNGFLRITDRLSRFSKIGGEMVPHGRIEEALHSAADLEAPCFIVTALPDEKKGERLAVLHTVDSLSIKDIINRLIKHGLPPLFIPRLDHFIQVESLPLLATGKVDLKRAQAILLESL